MNNTEILAYLAGVIDSDGCISIKRSTYQMRKGIDGTRNPTFSSKITLKQVTSVCPELLRTTFGGPRIKLIKGQTPNSRPLWRFEVTNRVACAVCEALLPYLRIKRRQAECCLELRTSKEPIYRRHAFWYEREHPNWRTENLMTVERAMTVLGYANRQAVFQALRNGTLLTIVTENTNRRARLEPEIPSGLVAAITASGNTRSRPPSLIGWRERLWNEVRHLNKVGVNGTTVFHRTGPHTLAKV